MKTHVILIPGFGMSAANMPQKLDGYVVHVVEPDWACGSFEKIVETVAAEIVEYERALVQNQPGTRLVVYGFSVGADILMQMSNSGKLSLSGNALLMLADPNVNHNTCFVTGEAAKAENFARFLEKINAAIEKPACQDKNDWESYLEWLTKNGADANWPAYSAVAGEIVRGIEQHFQTFFNGIHQQSGRRKTGNQRVEIIFSQDSSRAEFQKMMKHFNGIWVKHDLAAAHFRFCEPLLITGLITDLINRADREQDK